jgi:hypothetical protein
MGDMNDKRRQQPRVDGDRHAGAAGARLKSDRGLARAALLPRFAV